MILYHGTFVKNFKINKGTNSRYKFPALFFTSNKELAMKYAFYYFNKNGAGYLYEVDIDCDFHVVDFNSCVSHSYHFRNLICKLNKENHKAVLINKVVDFPSEYFPYYKTSSIIVLFDLDILIDVRFIGSVTNNKN